MDMDIKIAIIGVVGTLSGTLLGWFLNSITSHGKLKIYVYGWNSSITHYNNGGVIDKSHNKSEAEYYEFEFTLDIYNSSSFPDILRNITVEFCKDKEINYTIVPDDASTERYSSHCYIWDKIQPINALPKMVSKCTLRDTLNIKDDNKDIWDCNFIWLSYRDSKNKHKRILITRLDFEECFNNLSS